MASAALIGLGKISGHYKAGLDESEKLELVAVCDLLPQAPSCALYREYPFYTDYREMLTRERPDYVIVSTPPATHLEIATYALAQGVHVLLEKPAVQNEEELGQLVQAAETAPAMLLPMLHWQYSPEILAFCQQYDREKISEICISLQDPYSKDGRTIDPDRRGLLGTWLDSGINVLSYLAMVLPLEKVEILSCSAQKCEATQQPIFFAGKFLIDGVAVSITIDWRTGREEKLSRVTYEGREIVVHHSFQRVEDGQLVTTFDARNRLEQHYAGLFQSVEQGEEDLHKLYDILFRIGACL